MAIALPTVFSLVFIGIGGALLNFAFKTAAKARRSLSWPSVEGQIAHAGVLFQTETSPTQGSNNTFKAEISYRYQVGGRSYSSSKIALLDLASSSRRANELVSRYPDKSKVDVYYDPSNPSEAVLEPGSSSGLTFMYAIGAVFLLAGLFFLLMSLTGHVHTRA